MSAKTSSNEGNFKCAAAGGSEATWLQLITQNDVSTSCHHLVINMETSR